MYRFLFIIESVREAQTQADIVSFPAGLVNANWCDLIIPFSVF
jgi:hypothetical protein